MNDLNRALGDIRSIRQQMAQTTEFHGYGPVTLAATGVLALVAASVQALWLPDPAKHILIYVSIWIATAVTSAAFIGVQTVTRTHRMHSGLADEMIHMAVEQFFPSVAAGALLTLLLLHSFPSVLWMLPGLWQIIFSLGVFSSCRFLPHPMVAAGVWYLSTGLACIALGPGHALSPWTMGIAYGIGQFLVAGIMYFASEESRDESEI